MLRVGLPVHVEGELHEGAKALLALPQRLFRQLALGHIDRGADEFDEISRGVEDRMPDILDMFDRSIGQNNPVIIDVFSFLVGLPLDALSHPVMIFRVHVLPEFFAARTFQRIQPENSEHFVGPVSRFPGQRLVGPTARLGQPLRFSEMSFAPPQGLLSRLSFNCNSRQMCDLFYVFLIARARAARLAIIHGDSPDDFALRGEDRRRPTGAEGIGQSRLPGSAHRGSVAISSTITGSPRYAAVPQEPAEGPTRTPSMASV